MKKLKGWRTLGFNFFSLLAGLGSGAGFLPIPEEYIVLASAAGNIGLRFLTDTPAMSAGK